MDKFCDFESFAMIQYGICNNFKNLFILGLEFPELHSNVSWFNVYLKSRSVAFIDKMKIMYKDYVERCERNGMKCTVIEAIEQYGLFNYQELAHPKLRNIIEMPVQVDLLKPFNDFTIEKLPLFKGEELPRHKVQPQSFINPIISNEIADLKCLEESPPHKSEVPNLKRKFKDGRKYKGGGYRLH